MKAKYTWFDIERLLTDGTLEDQDIGTLRALSRVEPEPSSNKRYHFRFTQAIERIRHRISELEAKSEKNNPESDTRPNHASHDWHNKPVGKVFIGVAIGLILIALGVFIRLNFPEWFI